MRRYFNKMGYMRLTISVKPNARKEAVEAIAPGEYRVSVKAPAQEGRANEAVIRVLAEHFKVAKSRVRITHGHKGKKKLIEIEDG
jgi:uncharacterized protein